LNDCNRFEAKPGWMSLSPRGQRYAITPPRFKADPGQECELLHTFGEKMLKKRPKSRPAGQKIGQTKLNAKARRRKGRKENRISAG
jgi:hypothetical protein